MSRTLSSGGGREMLGQEIGNYRIIRELGRGSSGTVYEGLDVELGRRVAMKVLSGPLGRDPHAMKRLLAEARIASSLHSPNIVSITGFGRTRHGYGYVVMEFLDGKSLAQRLSDIETLPDAAERRERRTTLLRLCRQIATSMNAVHEGGIVHRDLKPENLFLVTDPYVIGGERAKILDFGMAKAQEDYARDLRPPFPGLTLFEPTQAGTVMGTPAYMAPEQWRAMPVDGRTDVYALGCILHEIVSGRPPFLANELELLKTQHLLQPPPPLHSLTERIGIDLPCLTTLVRRMLAKFKEDRPWMKEVAESLLQIEQDLEQVIGPTQEQRQPQAVGMTTGSAQGVVRSRFLRRIWFHSGQGFRVLMSFFLMCLLVIGVCIGRFYQTRSGAQEERSLVQMR